MDVELNERHRQVLGLEKLRRKRGYREGWLYHLCLQKGLLRELQDLRMAGLVGEASDTTQALASRGPVEAEVGVDGELLVPGMRLTVELVPTTCWFSNLRSELSKDEWDRL